jgi:hypothetical protein
MVRQAMLLAKLRLTSLRPKRRNRRAACVLALGDVDQVHLTLLRVAPAVLYHQPPPPRHAAREPALYPRITAIYNPPLHPADPANGVCICHRPRRAIHRSIR